MKGKDFVIGKKYRGIATDQVITDDGKMEFNFTVLAKTHEDVIGFLHGEIPNERKCLKELLSLQLRPMEYLEGKHVDELGEEIDDAIVVWCIHDARLWTWADTEILVPSLDKKAKK